tara:strand:- start:1478 stop:1657 length:180 start_codon:yes stop_codon:yes gene_type:complete
MKKQNRVILLEIDFPGDYASDYYDYTIEAMRQKQRRHFAKMMGEIDDEYNELDQDDNDE